MTVSQITPFSVVPNRQTDTPTAFSLKSSTFVDEQANQFIPDANALATQVNGEAIQVAADVLLTAGDVVLTAADVVFTGLDVIATGADVITTNADVVLADQAVIDANAAVGINSVGHSTTSYTIGLGAGQITVETGKGFGVGQNIKITDNANIANRMLGTVTGYITGTGVLNFTINDVGGSGTISDWTVIQANMGSLVEDTTPQLGGNLDLNGFDIPVSAATQSAIDALTKTDIGLGNVDNTSDANKPVSTATQSAIDSVTKTDVGLGNADNTSDANKPVSTATQSAIDSVTTAVSFVASGTLPNGKPVILNSNGTVTVVEESPTAVPESIPAGAETVFNSGTSTYSSVAFDPNNSGKFVVVYSDEGNSSYGTAVVGTVSGTAISFGSEYVFNSAYSIRISVAFDPNNSGKFVVAYRDGGNSNYGIAIVGTVSGTTISFGSEYTFSSTNSNYISVSFDPNNSGKFVVSYSVSGYGKATVGTVSGTAISFGPKYPFNSANTYKTSVAFDPNNSGKFVVAYQDAGNSIYGTAIVGTVSGTAISFGSEYVFNSSNSDYISITFDPNNSGNFVVACRDVYNSGYGKAIVGTVSGTAISFGSKYTFNSASSNHISVAFDPNNSGKFVVTYQDGGNASYGTAIVGTVSGTAISFGSEYVFNSGTSYDTSVAFDPNNSGKFVVAYRDGSNASYGTAVVGQIATTITTANLTATNLIGFASEAIADGDTGGVDVLGSVTTEQTGLAIGSTYYVQTDGTLAITVDPIVTVTAGRALSATSLLSKGL